MIFLQLIQSKNVKRNINLYISIVSLICSVFAIAEIKPGAKYSLQNCSPEDQKERTCQMVKTDSAKVNEQQQL